MTQVNTVLFLSPFSPGVPVQSGDLSFPPVGYLSIAGYCRQRYPETRFVFRDFMAERISLDEQMRVIRSYEPQIIGLAGRSFAYPAAVRLATRIKAEMPEVRVVLGGHHVTLMPESHEYPECFDTVVLGEGERAMEQLIHLYRQDEPWPNRLRMPFMPEDELGWDYAWDIVQQPQHYARALSPFYPDSMGSTVWSRGCPFSCLFCAAPSLWEGSRPAVRYRSAASICNELEYMFNVLGMRRIFIHDDVLNMSVGKLTEICEEIIRRGIKMEWAATGMRADEKLTPENMFPLLYRAGCRMISFGIESGDPEVLLKIDRKVTHAEVERALRLTRKYGMRTGGSFTMGHIWQSEDGQLDGEREENLQKTVSYVEKLTSSGLLWSVIIAIVDPVPGARLWAIAKKHDLLITEDLEDLLAYDRVRLNFKHPHLSPEVVERAYLRAYRVATLNVRHTIDMLLSIRSRRDLAGLLRAGWWVLGTRLVSSLRSRYLSKAASKGTRLAGRFAE